MLGAETFKLNNTSKSLYSEIWVKLHYCLGMVRFLFVFVAYGHQGCIYLTKNTVKYYYNLN